MGTFKDEKIQGELSGEFSDFTRTYFSESKVQDLDTVFEEVTSSKSIEEQDDIKKAGMFGTVIFRNIIDRVEQIIDEETDCAHSKIVNEIQELAENDNFIVKFVKE